MEKEDLKKDYDSLREKNKRNEDLFSCVNRLRQDYEDFKKDIESFENLAKSDDSNMKISLRDGWDCCQLQVPANVKQCIIDFVLENKEKMLQELEVNIYTKQKELLDTYKY